MSDSIRYEWRRAVNRDHRLTHAERRVLFELESYANPDGTNIRPGNERVAESLLTDEHTPMSEKTVRRAVKRAQDLGYIVQTAKARRAGDTWLAAVYRLKMPVDNPTASPDTQMSGHPVDNAAITGHFESDHRTFSDHHRTPGCPDTSSFNTSSINTIEKISVSSADRVDSRGGEKATSLPDTWAPNHTHRKTAATANVDVDMLAAEFRVAMTREKRADWDKTFGAFILATIEGRVDTTFPVPADDVDPFAPTSTSPSVDLGPDPTTQALDWVTPALWDEGINPDTLTADERCDVVRDWEPFADPRDVARRIREGRERRRLSVVPALPVTLESLTADVVERCGELTDQEGAYVAEMYEFGGERNARAVAETILTARKGAELARRAGEDPESLAVSVLEEDYLECAYDPETGDERAGDLLPYWRALRVSA